MALEVVGSNPTNHPTFLFQKEKKPGILGYSQVGKATDFDSVIPLVRVQLSQPNLKHSAFLLSAFYFAEIRKFFFILNIDIEL